MRIKLKRKKGKNACNKFLTKGKRELSLIPQHTSSASAGCLLPRLAGWAWGSLLRTRSATEGRRRRKVKTRHQTKTKTKTKQKKARKKGNSPLPTF
jgi:hypothetical protein